jgi:hypothetical protein
MLHDTLIHWASFQPRKDKPAVNPMPEKHDPHPILRSRQESTATIENFALRVGRNEPCPCESGEKFKKGCESASRRECQRKSTVGPVRILGVATPDADNDLIQGVRQNSSPARGEDDPPAISLACTDRDRSVDWQQANLLRRA